MNTFRTGLLMAFMTGLFVAIGYLIGGRSGPEPTRYGDWEKKGIISDF